MSSKLVYLILGGLLALAQNAYGDGVYYIPNSTLKARPAPRGVITFDDDFFKNTSGKVEGGRPRADDSETSRYGCTSVTGDRASLNLKEELQTRCRGDVRRLFLRERDQFVSMGNSGDTNEYFEVCCLPRGSRYQKHRWK